jgi:uncharacterized protein YaaR (DUF327 family)
MDVTDVIVNQIDDKVQQLQEAVSSGRAVTFEEYKKTCGEIKGLLIARGYALDLKQRLESSDE